MMNKDILNYLQIKFSNKTLEKRILKSATIEILTFCNFRCVHCYNQDLPTSIMEISDFKKIADELVQMGCTQITLTGGEPLIHPDFDEIYNYCFDRNLKVNIFSNGFLIDKKINLFKNKKPNKIEISIYGANNDTYKKICQVENGFDIVLKNLTLLISNNINFSLKTVILQQNFKEFDKIKKLSLSLKETFRFDTIILNSKNFTNDQKSNRLSSNYVKFMRKIEKTNISKWLDHERKNAYKMHNPYLYKCYAGRQSLFVSASCGIRICNFAQFSEINYKDAPIKKIWDRFKVYLNLQDDTKSECYSCKYKSYCSNCPVATYMNKKGDGTNLSPIEQNCREAKFIYESVRKTLNKKGTGKKVD